MPPQHEFLEQEEREQAAKHGDHHALGAAGLERVGQKLDEYRAQERADCKRNEAGDPRRVERQRAGRGERREDAAGESGQNDFSEDGHDVGGAARDYTQAATALCRGRSTRGLPCGQELGEPFVAQHHVGEEEVVVDHDDVGFKCRLTRLEHEALGMERAAAAEAVVARGCHLRPDRGVVGHIGQLTAIAGCACVCEPHDFREMPRIVARDEAAFGRRAF